MRGSCGCGSVTYELLRRPMFVHVCHCKNCQTQMGGPFALNAILETESLKVISGDLQPFKMATGSGLGLETKSFALGYSGADRENG